MKQEARNPRGVSEIFFSNPPSRIGGSDHCPAGDAAGRGIGATRRIRTDDLLITKPFEDEPENKE